MPNFIIKIKKIILLAGDVIGLFLALYLTLIARYGIIEGHDNLSRHLLPFGLVFATWIIIFFINNFYDLKINYSSTNLFNILSTMFIINAIMAVVIFYFFSPFIETIRPQRVLIINLAFSLIIIFIWRKIFYHFIKSSAITNKVLIIGQSQLSQILKYEISRRPQLGYQIIDNQATDDNLKDFCATNQINILINANDPENKFIISKKIFACLPLGVDVYNITTFYEQITNKIPVEHIDHSWFLENLTEHSKKTYEITKRLTDIVLSIIGLIFAILIVPIIAIIIKLESSGPVIFKQVRVGKNGKNFLAMKLRSMVSDAEKNGPQWAQKNDPRITRFGNIMRKTRLDEIPQLINILKGEMSFVGPRPERPEFVELLKEKIPFYTERLLAKPGLAGWAQLNGPAYGGSVEESLEKLKYDLYYIKNRSLLLDISVILKTIKVVLSGRGQ